MSSSFKIKPLVLAVSAMMGMLSTYQSSAASMDVTTSSGGLSIGSTMDYVDINFTGMVSGTDFGIVNTSTIGTLGNAGIVTGNDAIYNFGGSIGTLTNGGQISAVDGNAIWSDAAAIDSLFNSGTITGHKGVYLENNSYLGDFNNAGSIIASSDAAFLANNSQLCSFENSGTISGEQGVVLENDSMLYQLTNSGVISANSNDEDEDDHAAILLNNGSIYSIINSGLISGDGGIILENDANVDSITNQGTINAGLGIGAFSYYDDDPSSIGSIFNSGLIDADEGIIIADGSYLGVLNNSGTIDAGLGIGIFGYSDEEEQDSSIGTIVNTGLISAEAGLIVADGAYLGGLDNSNVIDANTAVAVYDGGTITSITNSGVIAGENAAIVNQNSALGPIYNTGLIAGNIYSTTGMVFYGGEGEQEGTLTGYDEDTIGTISIASSDLVFMDGNFLLNDNITMGEGTVINQAASVLVNNVLSVDGDYQQGSEAEMLFGVSNYFATTGDINTYNGYGRLVISGSATIASGSSIGLVSLGDYAFAQGQRYVVMQANSEGTNFHAGDLDYWVDDYDGLVMGSAITDYTNSNLTDLVVTLGDCNGNYTPIGYANTSNATSSLGGLFNYGGTDAFLLNVFNASAALGSTGAANRAGAQLSPAAVASAAAQAAAAPSMAVMNVINERGEAIRLAGDGARGVATGEGDGPVAWGQGFGGKVDQGSRNNISGYDATYGGLLIGGDGALNDEWRLGGLGSYANTLVDSKDDNAGSSVRVNSWGMFGYANYDGHPWIMNLSTGVVRHQYDTKRHIAFTGFSGDAEGSFHGMQYIAAGQLGYPMLLGSSGALLTPLAGVTYSIQNQDGYTETGGNGAGLHVESATSTSLKSDVGFKLERSFKVSSGIVHPFMQMGWRHEYHDDAPTSVANFSADNSGATSFSTRGLHPAADSGVWSVGAMMVGKHNLSLTVKYTGEAARNYQSHAGNVQLRWQF